MDKVIYEKIVEMLDDIKNNGLIREDAAGKDYVAVINYIKHLLERERRGKMVNIKKLNCGCDKNYLCLKAELLWNRANKIHDTLGFGAWKASSELKEYDTHRKELYDETRSAKNPKENAKSGQYQCQNSNDRLR